MDPITEAWIAVDDAAAREDIALAAMLAADEREKDADGFIRAHKEYNAAVIRRKYCEECLREAEEAASYANWRQDQNAYWSAR